MGDTDRRSPGHEALGEVTFVEIQHDGASSQLSIRLRAIGESTLMLEKLNVQVKTVKAFGQLR